MLMDRRRFLSVALRTSIATAISGGAIASIASACGGGSQSSTKANRSGSFPIRYALAGALNTPSGLLVTKFKSEVEAASQKAVTVTVFPNGQLGTTDSLVSQVKSGALQMTDTDSAYMAKYLPGASIFSLPFLWDRTSYYKDIVRGAIGKDFYKKLQGTTGLGVVLSDYGWRDIATRRRPIVTVDDLRGLKMRVIPSPFTTGLWGTFGVTTVSLAISELYTAVQQGVVEAFDSQQQYILDTSLYQVVSHVSQTRHLLQSVAFYYNHQWFQSLPSDIQEIVMKAMVTASDYASQQQAKYETTAARGLEAKGVKVNSLASAETTKFKNLLKGYYQKLVNDPTLGPDGQSWLAQLLKLNGMQ